MIVTLSRWCHDDAMMTHMFYVASTAARNDQYGAGEETKKQRPVLTKIIRGGA